MRKKEKIEPINIRTSRKEKRALKAKAKRYTKGNLSALLIKGGMAYKPTKK